MAKLMTLPELHDAIAKAIADAQGHVMREKCERHADAVLAIVGPQLLASAASSPSSERGGVDGNWGLVQETIAYLRGCPLAPGLREIRDVADNLANAMHQAVATPPAQAAQVDGIAKAAAYIQKKADDYAAENCSSEPDTGAPVYHFGNAGMDYHHTLIELAEEVAGLSPPIAEPVAQATTCAGCGKHKPTPLRIDAMGGYVCLTCIDEELSSLLGEFGYPAEPRAMLDDMVPAISDAIKILDDVAQFHGALPVGAYRHIRPRLKALLSAAPSQGEPS